MQPSKLPQSCPSELAALVREHACRVRRVLTRRGVSPADLPDAEQEVFIVAQRKLAQFEGRSSLATWLLGIASNVASQHRRKARHRRELLGVGGEPICEALDPLARLQAIETIARVRGLLDALSPEQREVIVLHELSELSMHETARELGIPLKTAFSRLYAGHRALRRTLERQGRRRESERPKLPGRLGAAVGFLIGLKWLPRARAYVAQLPAALLLATLAAPSNTPAFVLADPAAQQSRVEQLTKRDTLPVALAIEKPVDERAPRAQPRAARTPALVSSPAPLSTELVVFHMDGYDVRLPYPHPFAERAFASVNPTAIKPHVITGTATHPARQLAREACDRAHDPCGL